MQEYQPRWIAGCNCGLNQGQPHPAHGSAQKQASTVQRLIGNVLHNRLPDGSWERVVEEKALTYLDLTIPDLHFWHRITYQEHRREWIQNGDGTALASMLDAIAWTPGKPAGGTWENADDWNDSILSGNSSGTRDFSWAQVKKQERADLGFWGVLWIIGPLTGFFSNDVWTRRQRYRQTCASLKYARARV